MKILTPTQRDEPQPRCTIAPSMNPRLNQSTKSVLNALTVDVEDWFQVSGFEGTIERCTWDELPSRVVRNTEILLELFAQTHTRGTFYILGWVARRYPHLVRAIHAAGHEIGSHSYEHRLIYTQTPEQFRFDLRRSIDVLQEITGEPITLFRAPSFSITERSLWALEILVEQGIRLDSSIYPTHHDRYGIAGTPLEPHRISTPSGPLWEFPPPVVRIMKYPLPVGGGGYLRLYPYAMTRLGLNQINAEGRPFSVYVHPWEIDPEQPRVKAPLMRRWRHYVNLRRTESRLRSLLREFHFGTMSEALARFMAASATVPQKPEQAARAA
jgi:polysaccharide deacetylase family protein (PEP-CTERM system associated)